MKAKGNKFIFQAFIFELLFIFITNECNRSTPIKFNDGPCQLRFCSAKEFQDGKCVIDNEIAKTQYLNEIIILDSIHDDTKFDITKYSNGSLVAILSYSIPPESFREFYGLNNNEDKFLLEKKEIKAEDNKEDEKDEDNKELEKDEHNKENEKDEHNKEVEKDEDNKDDEKDEDNKENEKDEDNKENEWEKDNKENEKDEENNKENEWEEENKENELEEENKENELEEENKENECK